MACTELHLIKIIFLLLSLVWKVASQMRIPIGTIFPQNETSLHVRSAFGYGLEKDSPFRFEMFEASINRSDEFEISKTICTAISKRPFALFGILDASALPVTSDFMNAFNMPLITISNPIGYSTQLYNDSQPLLQQQQQHNDFILYMKPAYDKALIDFVLDYKWPKIFYVFDDLQGLYRLEKLFEAVYATNSSLEIKPVKLLDVRDSYETLRQMNSIEPDGKDKWVVLDLSTEEGLLSILKQIQLVGLNRKGFHYILGGIAFDEIDILDFKRSGVNIIGFRLTLANSTELQKAREEWLLIDPVKWPGAGNGTEFKLEAALALDSVSVLTRALTSLLDENNDGLSSVDPDEFPKAPCTAASDGLSWKKGGMIMEYLKRVNFTGMSGEIAFDDRGRRKDFSLEVYELNLNRDPRQIASWEYNKGLTKIGDTATSSETVLRKPKLENRTTVVTSILTHPFLSLRRADRSRDAPEGQGIEMYEGYCADTMKALAGILGLKYELRLVEDGRYGSIGWNGTWSGMIGELITGKADIAVAPLTITSMRERVVDFTVPYMDVGISIMVKKPQRQDPGVFRFLDPFDAMVWLGVFASYLATGFVLFLVGRFSSYSWQVKEVKDVNVDGLTIEVGVPDLKNEFNFSNSFWFALGGFMRQGCCVSPRSLSGRVVGNVWWFFSVIFVALYTAGMTVFILRENRLIPESRLLPPIYGAFDLAGQSSIVYGTVDGGSTKEFFRFSTVPVYEEMWEFMVNQPEAFAKTVEEGVSRVRQSQGDYAFLLESSMNDFYNHRKPCNTMKVGGNLDTKGYGVATRHKSPLRETINHAVLVLIEQGFFAKLYKKWWFDKGECHPIHEEGRTHPGGVTLKQASGLFVVLLVGLSLSMVAFSLELYYFRKKVKVSMERLHNESVDSTSLDVATPEGVPPAGVVTTSDPIPTVAAFVSEA